MLSLAVLVGVVSMMVLILLHMHAVLLGSILQRHQRSVVVAHHMYSTPPYPYQATDYETQSKTRKRKVHTHLYVRACYNVHCHH